MYYIIILSYAAINNPSLAWIPAVPVRHGNRILVAVLKHNLLALQWARAVLGMGAAKTGCAQVVL